MRPAIIAEQVGIPSVAVVATSFLPLARDLGRAEGIPDQRLADYPGTLSLESEDVIRERFARLTLGQIVDGLTGPVPATSTPPDGERPAALTGTADEVDEVFRREGWTDGLPIVLPSAERVEAFLEVTDRNPDEAVVVLAPGRLRATPRTIAANAAMAGCRPEHLPLLVAAAEALGDARFNLEQAGTTGAITPYLLVNGPIIRQLGLEHGIALTSRGPNPAIGRALGLILRNVADLRPGGQAMGTFGYLTPFVLAEDEEASPWEPYHVAQGFERNVSTVTARSTFNWGFQAFPSGTDAEGLLAIICREIVKHVNLNIQATLGLRSMMTVLINPSVAQAIARAGYTRRDVQRYLHEHSRVAIGEISFESRYGYCAGGSATIRDLIALGWATPPEWAELPPDATVPVMVHPDLIDVVVCGDRNRNKAMALYSVYNRPVTRRIPLPADWTARGRAPGDARA